jgi:hypothetical protein
LKPKHIWAIRSVAEHGRTRALAMFNCAIDSKLRGCDLVRLRVQRAAVIQQKTGRPVPFELTDPTREALAAWLAAMFKAALRLSMSGVGANRSVIPQPPPATTCEVYGLTI